MHKRDKKQRPRSLQGWRERDRRIARPSACTGRLKTTPVLCPVVRSHTRETTTQEEGVDVRTTTYTPYDDYSLALYAHDAAFRGEPVREGCCHQRATSRDEPTAGGSDPLGDRSTRSALTGRSSIGLWPERKFSNAAGCPLCVWVHPPGTPGGSVAYNVCEGVRRGGRSN